MFAVPNQVVRGLLAVPLFPVRFFTQGEGVPADFIVTDSRIPTRGDCREGWRGDSGPVTEDMSHGRSLLCGA